MAVSSYMIASFCSSTIFTFFLSYVIYIKAITRFFFFFLFFFNLKKLKLWIEDTILSVCNKKDLDVNFSQKKGAKLIHIVLIRFDLNYFNIPSKNIKIRNLIWHMPICWVA